ncbi:MAG: 50S ribosomal protein L11 methyltransferase [Clostridiales bacterium]|jgi:ribosomal protein L11 methyltransferase|nr:50S ribosomal protein L11 methyltransferase [Clostridiales bacterium]
MQWLQVNVITTTEGSDLVSLILMDAGSEGVSIRDDNDIRAIIARGKTWDYADESLLKADSGRVTVSGCFSPDTDLAGIIEGLEALHQNAVVDVGSLETLVVPLDSADWENEWRKYYAPIEFDRLAIVPAWLAYDKPGKRRVLLDPGSAFGTGSHETTGLCVTLLEAVSPTGKTVIDVGCGSGILGICALSLGAARCLFTDIDEGAVRAAKENAALNGVDGACRYYLGSGLPDGEPAADLVLANLTADILLALKNALVSAVKPDGHLIVSGVIAGREAEVEAAFSDLTQGGKVSRGDWFAYAFKKDRPL